MMLAWDGSPALLLAPAAFLLNLAITFFFTLGFAYLAARLSPEPRVRALVLLLPFAKLGYDAVRGIPADNYTLSAFAGTRWELGRFMIGYGFQPDRELLPSLELHLSALRDSSWHSLSAGDLLAHALFYRGGGALLMLLVLVCVVGASVRLAARARAFRRVASTFGTAGGRGLRLGRVRVRRLAGAACGAFTTGVWRQTIWLPRRADGYSHAELSAILRHELAHAARADVALFALCGIASDLLWFVPGVRRLLHAIHEAVEQAADARAVARGADPGALARALCTAAERRLAGASEPGLETAAYAAGMSSTVRRVHSLLRGPERRPRWRGALWALLSLSLAFIALHSSFFGAR